MADCNMAKSPWDMTTDERIESARCLKESGNLLFSKGKIEEARESYSTALKRVIPVYDVSEEIMEEVNLLKLPLYLNIAACQMKLEHYEYVIKNCTKALEIESKNIKALYRRCVALTEINEFERACKDAEEGLSIEENNQALKRQLLKIERDWKEKTARYQEMMRNCFTEGSRVTNDVTKNEMTLT